MSLLLLRVVNWHVGVSVWHAHRSEESPFLQHHKRGSKGVCMLTVWATNKSTRVQGRVPVPEEGQVHLRVTCNSDGACRCKACSEQRRCCTVSLRQRRRTLPRTLRSAHCTSCSLFNCRDCASEGTEAWELIYDIPFSACGCSLQEALGLPCQRHMGRRWPGEGEGGGGGCGVWVRGGPEGVGHKSG